MKVLLIWLMLTVPSLLAAAQEQQPTIIGLTKLMELIAEPSEKVKVVNFWATWCGPCVKELPLFERLNAEQSSKADVFLVSMDLDLDRDPAKVFKFIERKQIKSNVLILDADDPNSWIDKIDKNWSGALPATLIINQKTGKRKFVEKELHEGDLEKLIEEVKN